MFPVRSSYKWVENLKVGGSYRDINVIQFVDYGDPDVIDRLISDNNVVINLIGGNTHLKKYKYHHEANVDMARRIA